MRYKILPGLIALVQLSFAQSPIIDNWTLNTTGATSSYWENSNGSPTSPSYIYHTSTTLADVTSVCYKTDSVWIECEGMTNDMGKFLNPGEPSGQGYTFRFPRNPSAASTKLDVPYVFSIGVLTNGIPIFGMSNSNSWKKSTNSNSPTGDGYWNGEAWYNEGFVLDSTFGAHPQADGAYHSHATPKRLYTFPSTAHSPLVGFAFDGYPVYGPYGYTTATDASSGVSRMTSSYSLRNITTRTTLPDGTVLSSQYYGPNVNTTYPLGYYIEDYQYVNGSGTLDQYNGRYCVTPEYPSGTYAYFVTVDAAGDPAFPFYIGLQYYGNVDQENLNINNTLATPTSGTTCRSGSTTGVANPYSKVSSGSKMSIGPNPVTNGQVMVQVSADVTSLHPKLKIYSPQGVLMRESNLPSSTCLVGLEENMAPGLYYAHLINDEGRTEDIVKVIVQ